MRAGIPALKDVTLTLVERDVQLAGFPNGAGKSSPICDHRDASGGGWGRAAVFLDYVWTFLATRHWVRQLLGYLPQEFGAHPKISAERMLDCYCEG